MPVFIHYYSFKATFLGYMDIFTFENTSFHSKNYAMIIKSKRVLIRGHVYFLLPGLDSFCSYILESLILI